MRVRVKVAYYLPIAGRSESRRRSGWGAVSPRVCVYVEGASCCQIGSSKPKYQINPDHSPEHQRTLTSIDLTGNIGNVAIAKCIAQVPETGEEQQNSENDLGVIACR